MKIFPARRISIIALTGAASFLLSASPRPSLAQRGNPAASAAERRVETMKRQAEQFERDNPARGAKASAEDSSGRRRAQELAGQVTRDFEGLQDGYNKIVLAMARAQRPDPDAILESVAEVRKCAVRLRQNLALPRAKDDEKEKAGGAAGAPETEESLILLRKHIYNFLTNPLFDSATALDVEQAARAGRDLDMILELSERIKRSGRPNGRHD